MKTAFGLNLPTSADTVTSPAGLARRAETLGFDFISASDHPCGVDRTFETWTMLTWVAAATSKIQIATRVLGMPYRPPAMVAKMGETLNRLSGGRLILGLGGGYSDHEFRAFGLKVPTPREKVNGLEDGVSIIRGLWGQASFSYAGELYHVAEADLEPKPDRPIPIWLGTFGPRALAVTGRVADGWIPSLAYAPPAEIGEMRDRIRTSAEAAGRDPDAITLAYNVDVLVDERAEPADTFLSGTPAMIAERLVGFTDLGFSTFNFMPDIKRIDEQAERLANEVIPLVREAVR